MQKILIMSTMTSSLRSEAVGWSAEDGDEAAKYSGEPNRPVGLMGFYKGFYSFATPYHALGRGWKLMIPPKEYQENCMQQDGTSKPVTMWEWWFTKD